ncbi:MAG: hypothetical protein IKR04_04235 [Clostridia bacterium]|nr:hypothetical protein [Clostridia bacterium]
MQEDFIGLGTLLFIFGILLALAGIYIFTGHKNQFIFGRAWVSAKNASKDQLRVIGSIILVIAVIVLIIGGVLLVLSQV